MCACGNPEPILFAAHGDEGVRAWRVLWHRLAIWQQKLHAIATLHPGRGPGQRKVLPNNPITLRSSICFKVEQVAAGALRNPSRACHVDAFDTAATFDDHWQSEAMLAALMLVVGKKRSWS
mmetsp:Transcript_76112/g.234969  ORF Transcript_76112/g.234969 Transcript_76112/m.234969 type:complete len:121 (+) Transcript_76112:851-1213(+)